MFTFRILLSRHSRQTLIALAGLFVTLTATHAAESVDAKTLSERHTQVVKMSTVERERLQRNLDEFKKLSPEKQEQYRQLNSELDEDRKRGGQLSSLMETYSAWLQTLTPSQREQLRQVTDSSAKLNLVQKFKEEQLRESLTSVESPAMQADIWKPRPFLTLNPQELHNILRILIGEFPEEDQKDIGRVNRLDQYPEILRRSIQQADNPREWPTEELRDKIISSLPPRFKPHLTKSNQKRELLLPLIFNSIYFQTMEELKSRLPNEKELQQVFTEMNSNEQSRLDLLPTNDRRFVLSQRFFDKNPDRAPRREQEVYRSIHILVERLGIAGMVVKQPLGPPLRPEDRGPDDRPPPRFYPEGRPGRDGPRPEAPPPRREGRDGRNNRKEPNSD
jgi:hypothetical protein